MKSSDFSVSFKEYVSSKVVTEEWPYAIKRTIDLSMDPAGRLYGDWGHHSKQLKVMKKKS